MLALILFVVGIIFTGKATEVEASANDPITIQADAQQWVWRYEYPVSDPSPDGFNSDAAYSYQELVVPVDTPINLEISSTDVLHRWSVPSLALSADAVPGLENEVSFTANETGTYEGASTQFSGPGYATMRTRVIVVEPDQYEAFLKERVAGIEAARKAVQERVARRNGAGSEVRAEMTRRFGPPRIPRSSASRSRAPRRAGSRSSPPPSTRRSGGCTSPPRCSSRAPRSPSC